MHINGSSVKSTVISALTAFQLAAVLDKFDVLLVFSALGAFLVIVFDPVLCHAFPGEYQHPDIYEIFEARRGASRWDRSEKK